MLFVAELGSGDLFWSIMSIFFIVMYLMMLFSVLTDVFRDHELSGWAKAIWLIALLVIPLISLLVYVIVRGPGMAKRQMKAAEEADDAARAYIRSAAGTAPAEQIAQAKTLLDQGAISQDEFDRLKARATGA